jgi:hypothetical protein
LKSIGKEITKGNRDLDTGLWRINLRKYIPHNPISAANNVYELRNTGELVNYLHNALFSPTKAVLIKAVKKGHLATWPGLTSDAIKNHLKLTPAMVMGHINQNRQHAKHPLHKQGGHHHFILGGYNSNYSRQWRQNTFGLRGGY